MGATLYLNQINVLPGTNAADSNAGLRKPGLGLLQNGNIIWIRRTPRLFRDAPIGPNSGLLERNLVRDITS